MSHPQSTKDKWFMRGKDVLLFILGSGALLSMVHVWEAPKDIKDLSKIVGEDKAFANTIDRRTLVLETNMANQTTLLQDIKSGQSNMWKAIRDIQPTRVVVDTKGE